MASAIGVLGNPDDEEDDYEYFYNTMIRGTFGDTAAQVLRYGLPALAGYNFSGTFNDPIAQRWQNGFTDKDKQIDLTLGTRNNNTPSPSLLRNYADIDYVQLVSYTNGSGERVMERPEMHLLNRMVEHYKTMRRTMEAKIATGIDLFRNRFEYNGRVFFGIDKKHDWERDEQEVKFIEVN
jgi:hypothetical protein